ncbi:jg6122 [Pararge aegeria aegeria]|uniref:Jg6122 protein n=1 Tax=Pararge aegeria aegeria TaxID=348720 RepID=A0A8S4RCU5_9NEOP|nr:jg6122 [Pararge aegeria aegeria]
MSWISCVEVVRTHAPHKHTRGRHSDALRLMGLRTKDIRMLYIATGVVQEIMKLSQDYVARQHGTDSEMTTEWIRATSFPAVGY